VYEYAQLVESYRVGTKSFRKVHAFLGSTTDPHSVAYFIKHLAFEEVLKQEKAYLYALPTAIYTICKNTLQLPTLFQNLFGNNNEILICTLLMIIHRIIDPDSKLSLTRWYKNILLPVSLPEELDVHTLYDTLDQLFAKKEEIEHALFALLRQQKLIDATIIFYDLTSSYFEGDHCPIGKKSYSRDYRPDRPQIVLCLAIDKKHKLPIYSEVYEGNMSDGKTVKQTIDKLKKQFGIMEVVFVADKGMLTPDNLEELANNNYQYILSQNMDEAFTKESRKELFMQKKKMIHLQQDKVTQKDPDSLWYQETVDKNNEKIIVCYNPKTYALAKHTRDAKLKRLQDFINETKKKHREDIGQTQSKEEKQIKIQKIRDTILSRLVSSRARKYFDTKKAIKEIETVDELFTLKQEVVDRDEHMDGFFLVKPNANLITEELIRSYKELRMIEDSFRTLKTFIELRPIYHWTTDRVKAHVFLCVLSFLAGRILEIKTGKTIKMLREEYASAVAIKTTNEKQPLILGGQKLLQAVQ
jgi:transposase